jgi:hypothetical protein
MNLAAFDYLCPAGHRSDSLEERAEPGQPQPPIPCPTCGKPASVTISATHHKTCWASAGTRGKPEPMPCPTATDTSALGEGQSFKEWTAGRQKNVWAPRDRKKRRDRGAPL